MKKKLAVSGVFIALVVGVTSLCQAQERSQVDLRALRQQLQSFQDVLNRNVQQNFEHPFALLQDAKGIYLPWFGVAFHMEVNLYPLRMISPFAPEPYSAEELRKAKESKLERIRQLKEQLRQLLLEHAVDLGVVPGEQNVAIVVHLFNLPSERSDDLPTQLVIGASRQALLDYQAHRLTAEDFRNREFSLDF
ncbi:MAG: hypothetical protein A3H27_09680 [Acidobacteria bacterium RIFCSPLOWO2_02_FULL_59_13]|nr:MAG: hypothetical protein A3H27_09680 [Acidobacteria bacterium RIFCSPLOWO2_02_FULL_59_13]